MPAIVKNTTIKKGSGAVIVSSDVKSHANDPVVIKKVQKARETLERVGLPGQKKDE